MEGDWKKRLEQVSIVKRCPKCHSLSLRYNQGLGTIRCDDCGYEAAIDKM